MDNTSKLSNPHDEQFDARKHKFTYKNLTVWQKSIQFASDVMELTETLNATRKKISII